MAHTSGSKLGPYEIVALIGAGGMGEVYKARDARLERIVAIKVLPASFSADHDRMQRFAQEARATAALNHSNIVAIYDIGEEKGAPYVVTELLEGETLRERLKVGALSSRKAIDYAIQIARGLAAAHEKGIVHRDLKPENIFLTNDGGAKILDFGLAKLTRPESQSGSADAPTMQAATEPGLIMGTAGYMSPEQVRGKAADHRSDIFAFGAILYEMLTGERAFKGETMADTMSAILKEDPPELSESVKNIPPGVERVVRHCLEKNPAQRFQSAGDLAFDLESLSQISSGASGGLKSGAQVAVADVPESKLGRAPIYAGAAVLALLIGIAGWFLGRKSAYVPPPQFTQITFRTGRMGNARFTPDGSVVYSARWEGGDRQLYIAKTGDPGSRELGVKDAVLLAVSKNGELAIRLRAVALGGYAAAGTLARLPLAGGTPREVLDNVQDAEWAPDGENMAVVRFVPDTHHWRLEYPIGKALLDTINWISTPKISPDGKWIAFSDHQNTLGDDEGAVAVIDMQGHEKILSAGWSSVEGVGWSPSGDEVWFSASDTGAAENLRGVTLSGKLRTITNVPGGMWLQDMRDGEVLMITHRARVGIRGMAPGAKTENELGWLGWSELRDISRDGTKVLFEEEADGGGPNYTVFLRDMDGSPPVKIGEGMAEAISPDNKWVITKPAKGGPLSLVPTGAGEARQLTHDKISYSLIRFLPDGRQLVAVGIEEGHGAREYLIDVGTGDSKAITPEGTSGPPVLSPDGRSIAVYTPEGKIGIWPLDGSGGIKLIPGVDPRYRAVGWTPDGTALLTIDTHERGTKVYHVNIATGKVEFWKSFGGELPTTASPGFVFFSADNKAYAYLYSEALSEAYVVKGLR